MAQNQIFSHALMIDRSICVGCTHCMRVCPTHALRVRKGKAVLYPDRCIDCGECFRACPINAIKIKEDDLSALNKYKIKVALVPAVMLGQFPDNISIRHIYKAIYELGFTHIYEVEQSIDFLKKQIIDYQKKSDIKPLISSFCPAIVRLIQVRFPSLTDNIIKLRTPKDLTAEIILDNFTKQGFDVDEIGIFYITPCAAKIAAIKSPVGEEKSVINGVINMNSFFNMIMNKCKSNHYSNEDLTDIQPATLPPMAITWSLTRGEAQYVKGRSFAVDGIGNVCDFLEKIENDEIQDVDFLELRACDESCAGGILCTKNRFLTVESLYKRASQPYSKRQNIKFNKDISKLLINKMNITTIEPRPMNLDDDLEKAIQKMERIRDIMCFLPNVDCGLCGAPNCKTLAEDIANNKAHISDCIFIQYKNLTDPEQAKNILSKIWGENVFDKDCSKKGAKYEGS
jgi:Na+-translocating ferredoxin:NAD+ oxidoreductase RNF subunit RnfB